MVEIREITNENIDELIVTEIREGLYSFLIFTNKKTLCYTSQCMAWESTGKDSTIGFCKRLK